MKIILAFMILGNVVAAESAIECVTCKVIGDGVDNCNGEVQKCAEGEVCATQIEYNIMGDQRQTIKKGCLPESQKLLCNQQMTMNSTDGFQYLLYSKCCYEDCCNTGPIQMPSLNLTKNEKVCTSCFVRGNYECSEFETRECTGNQTQCMEFTGIAGRPDDCDMPYAFVGCVTYGACFVDLQRLPGTRVDKKAMYTCR